MTAIDRDLEGLTHLQRAASSQGLAVTTLAQDLEAGEAMLGTNVFDVIVVVHYLHRPLFPALLEALCPGGLLVYETFTRTQATFGKPTNPRFLLEPGELGRLVQSLEVLDAREGFFDGRHVASSIARR